MTESFYLDPPSGFVGGGGRQVRNQGAEGPPTIAYEAFVVDLPAWRPSECSAVAGVWIGAVPAVQDAYFPGGMVEYRHPVGDTSAPFKIAGNVKSAATTGLVLYTADYPDARMVAQPSPNIWDRYSRLFVKMDSRMGFRQPRSRPESEVLGGANRAMIGGGEVIGFANVKEGPHGTYELTDLLRGQLGTEHTLERDTSLLAFESFVMLDDALTFVPLDASVVGRQHDIVVQPVGQRPPESRGFPVDALWLRNARPWPVANIQAGILSGTGGTRSKLLWSSRASFNINVFGGFTFVSISRTVITINNVTVIIICNCDDATDVPRDEHKGPFTPSGTGQATVAADGAAPDASRTADVPFAASPDFSTGGGGGGGDLPPIDYLDAIGKGIATTWPGSASSVFVPGVVPGQRLLVESGDTYTQPGGGTIGVLSGDELWWNGTAWVVAPPAGSGGGGVTELPPASAIDAVAKGVNIAWPVPPPTNIPDGVLIGQCVEIVFAGTYYRPDGTTPIATVGVGDKLIWIGSGWTRLDLVTQADLDFWLPAFLARSSNLADVADVPSSRANLDVYSTAETDAVVLNAANQRNLKTANLSDVSSVTTARTNLDVFSKTEINTHLSRGFPTPHLLTTAQLPTPVRTHQILHAYDPTGSTAVYTMSQPPGAGGTILVTHGERLRSTGTGTTATWVSLGRASATSPFDSFFVVQTQSAVAVVADGTWRQVASVTIPAGAPVGSSYVFVSTYEIQVANLVRQVRTSVDGTSLYARSLSQSWAGGAAPKPIHGEMSTIWTATDALVHTVRIEALIPVGDTGPAAVERGTIQVSRIGGPAGPAGPAGAPGGGDMLRANNLSDVASTATSRTNLDVYSKAETDTADGLRNLKSANLSDVPSPPTARTSLSVYSKGEVDTKDNLRLEKIANLSDVANNFTARGNLGVYSTVEVDTADALRNLKTANLSDVANAATARANLDVLSAGESQAGDDARLEKVANLADVDNVADARVNLDVPSIAEMQAGDLARLAKSANLSDIPDAPTARANIEVYGIDDVDTLLAAKMAKASNLSDVASVATSRTNLGVYSTADVDTALALKLAKASNLADVASVGTSRTNLSVYSKAEVDALLAAIGSSSGVMAGRIGTMLRLPHSFYDPFEERTQHPNYWTTDLGGTTGGGVGVSPTPNTNSGGVGWVRLFSTASSVVSMWPTQDVMWPTLTSGWVTMAFRFFLKAVSGTTTNWIGLGGPMVANQTPVNHISIEYAGGAWALAFYESGQTSLHQAFTSTPPTPTSADAPWWGMVQIAPSGQAIGVLRSPGGTEYATALTTPSWGDPASLTRYMQPWAFAGFGSEAFIDSKIIWDGATLQIATAPIAS